MSFFISFGVALAGIITFVVCCVVYECGTRTPEEQKQEDEAQKAFLKNNVRPCRK